VFDVREKDTVTLPWPNRQRLLIVFPCGIAILTGGKSLSSKLGTNHVELSLGWLMVAVEVEAGSRHVICALGGNCIIVVYNNTLRQKDSLVRSDTLVPKAPLNSTNDEARH